MTGSADDILDVIDGSLRDNSVSLDAMRWSPDPEAAEAAQAITAVHWAADVEAFTTGLSASVAAFGAQMQSLGRAMAKALAPVAGMVRQFAHDLDAHDRPRWHRRHCRACNPAGNPLPLPGGAEYRRRQLARKRRAR